MHISNGKRFGDFPIDGIGIEEETNGRNAMQLCVSVSKLMTLY